MASEEEPEQGTNSFPRNNRKILIVDDDETVLYLLRRYFLREQFEVLVARSGLEAKERLKTQRPDIVLTDLKMPSFSGADLIGFIHQNMKNIPIIVMTAYPYLYPKKKSENEVTAYFVKPFDVNEIFTSVKRILGGRS